MFVLSKLSNYIYWAPRIKNEKFDYRRKKNTRVELCTYYKLNCNSYYKRINKFVHEIVIYDGYPKYGLEITICRYNKRRFCITLSLHNIQYNKIYYKTIIDNINVKQLYVRLKRVIIKQNN